MNTQQLIDVTIQQTLVTQAEAIRVIREAKALIEAQQARIERLREGMQTIAYICKDIETAIATAEHFLEDDK